MKSKSPLSPLSIDYIRWAYRLFLDREPDSDAIIAPHLDACKDTKELRHHITNSLEFHENCPSAPVPTFPGRRPPLPIELELTSDKLDALFDRVETDWEAIGGTDPHWSVMGNEQFRSSNIASSIEEFYETGKSDSELLENTLRRNGLDIANYKTCVEIGCGVGRITSWLCKHFENVFAYDISSKHLDLARDYFERTQISNARFSKFESIDQISSLPKVDLAFSLIVLQHNPPPVIAFMIEHLLGCLNQNGVALFQVPTYIANYSFAVEDYLNEVSDPNTLEMHAIPQCEVFKIARNAGFSKSSKTIVSVASPAVRRILSCFRKTVKSLLRFFRTARIFSADPRRLPYAIDEVRNDWSDTRWKIRGSK